VDAAADREGELSSRDVRRAEQPGARPLVTSRRFGVARAPDFIDAQLPWLSVKPKIATSQPGTSRHASAAGCYDMSVLR
jgi:hypothetical protein